MGNYASFAVGAVVLLAPFAASSHFLLLEPANLLVQNNRGDPQKAAPCGGTSEDRGTPSDAITEALTQTLNRERMIALPWGERAGRGTGSLLRGPRRRLPRAHFANASNGLATWP